MEQGLDILVTNLAKVIEGVDRETGGDEDDDEGGDEQGQGLVEPNIMGQGQGMNGGAPGGGDYYGGGGGGDAGGVSYGGAAGGWGSGMSPLRR